jgi:hypothetical protein
MTIRFIAIVSVLQDALTEKVFQDIARIKFTVLLQFLNESEVDVAVKKLVDSIVFQSITNLRGNNLVSLTHTLHVTVSCVAMTSTRRALLFRNGNWYWIEIFQIRCGSIRRDVKCLATTYLTRVRPGVGAARRASRQIVTSSPHLSVLQL